MWKRVSLAAAVALATAAAPAAVAQDAQPAPAAPAAPAPAAVTPGGSGTVTPGGADRGAFRGHRGDGRHWGGHRHYHHRRYPRYYHDPFGPAWGPYYPYGMGYGYGYPYYGASAALYYHGYRPQPRVYRGVPVGATSLEARVQQQLAQEGYYRGAIDGVIGNGTRAAIRAFQRDRGLPVTGRIDNRLLAQLRLR